MEYEQIKSRNDAIQSNNFHVSLQENKKKFETQLATDVVNAIRNTTFNVSVNNQNKTISIDNLIDYSKDIINSSNAIVEAIRGIPQTIQDNSDIVESIKNIPIVSIPEYPKTIEVSNQIDLTKSVNEIIETIKSIPKSEKIDLSKIEKLLSDKTIKSKELLDVVSLLQSILESLNKEEVIEEKPKKLSVVIDYYDDGTFKSSTTTFSNKICIETRLPGDKSDTYLYEEVDV